MVTNQYRVSATIDTQRPEDGGLTGFYTSPVTSLLIEPEDRSVLEGMPYDCFGGVVIDLAGRGELRAGLGQVDVVITFLDGADARRSIRPGSRFRLRLGNRTIGHGIVGEVVQELRTA